MYVEHHAEISPLSIISAVLFVIYLSLCVVLPAAAVVFLFLRRFRKSISLFLMSVFVITSLLSGRLLTTYTFLILDKFRLFISQDRYEQMVKDKLDASYPKLVFLDWGSTGF